ncbi:hypothetical protein LDL08_35905 [Nonomuraea glycinis]|nr:hypothetical protein [Nonomuraea glycinis]MCA2181558.1 hypothetical protein [Nonomuraea glycinis]
MTFTFFPYWWGAKPDWKDRALLDDVDDLFVHFLRAGAARVLVPVRPSYEQTVLHYIESGQLWIDGDPPPITSERYLPMLEELRAAENFPPAGGPVGDPWEVRVPTTLVHLRADNTLPK